MSRVTVSFAAMVILFALVLVGFSCTVQENRKRSRETRDLVVDIQANRVFSCRRTYESFNEVFAPFFPPPRQRTQAQRENLQKLNKTVKRLKRSCGRQTKPREAP